MSFTNRQSQILYVYNFYTLIDIKPFLKYNFGILVAGANQGACVFPPWQQTSISQWCTDFPTGKH